MSRPQTSFRTLLWPQNSLLGPKRFKNDPKNKSNWNVIFEGIIEIESCSTTWVDLKTVFEPHNRSLGPQKVKNGLKIKSKLD